MHICPNFDALNKYLIVIETVSWKNDRPNNEIRFQKTKKESNKQFHLRIAKKMGWDDE